MNISDSNGTIWIWEKLRALWENPAFVLIVGDALSLVQYQHPSSGSGEETGGESTGELASYDDYVKVLGHVVSSLDCG